MRKAVGIFLLGLVFMFGCSQMNTPTVPSSSNDENVKIAVANATATEPVIDVKVSVNKTYYEIGEPVEITVENFGDPITAWLTGGCDQLLDFYKIESDSLRQLRLVDPNCIGNCMMYPVPLNTGESHTGSWDQLFYGFYSTTGNLDPNDLVLGPGLPDLQHEIKDPGEDFSTGLTNPTSVPAGYYFVNLPYYEGLHDLTTRYESHSQIFSIGIPPEDTTDLADAYIENIPADVFSGDQAEQQRNALSEKLAEVQALIDAGDYSTALDKLQHDIRPKTDGCFGGNPNNDWITDCETQEMLLNIIDCMIAQIQELL